MVGVPTVAVIVDTSFIMALLNPGDAWHGACLRAASDLKTSLIVPITVLPEVAYLTESRLGHAVMRRAMAELLRPEWTLEAPNLSDLQRANELLEQYGDAKLDFVDATLIAIAERLRIRSVLTLDQRHFRLIRPRHCPAFDLLPARATS